MSRPVKIQAGIYRMTAYGTKKPDYLITNSNRSGWHIYSSGSLVGVSTTLRGAEQIVDAMNRRDRKVHEESTKYYGCTCGKDIGCKCGG